MSNPYSQTLDHILVALSDTSKDVAAAIDDLIKQNQELVDENRQLREKLALVGEYRGSY